MNSDYKIKVIHSKGKAGFIEDIIVESPSYSKQEPISFLDVGLYNAINIKDITTDPSIPICSIEFYGKIEHVFED